MSGSLWDRRLLVVTGKGGVGKSTVAAALALAAAQTGRRAVIIELNGGHRVAELFELPGRQYAPRKVAAGVDLISLTAPECIEDFGRRKMRVGGLFKLLLQSRVTSTFLDAVPGLHDLLQLGKLENLLFEPEPGDPHYDLAIVDGPATGHALTLLASARAMADMTRAGPFTELARVVEALLADPVRTGVVVATLAEELPVNETLELVSSLGADAAVVAAAIVNRCGTTPLPPARSWTAVREALMASGRPAAATAVALGDNAVARREAESVARSRLADALPKAVRIASLPELGDGALTPAHLTALGAALVGPLGEAL